MVRYVLMRVSQMLPVLFIMSILIFLLVRVLPGDPVRFILGPESTTVDPSQRAALEHSLGLDRPLFFQYVDWLRGLLSGHWGRSFIGSLPIELLIRQRLVVTLQLSAAAWLLAVCIGVPVGIFSALKRNTWPDTVVNAAALAGVAMPNFLLGLLLIVVFGVYLHLLPTNGFVSVFTDPIEGIRHLAMPAIALAAGLMASLVRQTRSAMLEVMNEDYIRTARSKGLSPRRVVIGHAMKNAMLPVVTVAGIQVGHLASGTVIVETMFAVPGMGRLTIDALRQNDYALVQIVVLIFALTMMTASLLADLTYVSFDPRIRLGQRERSD